VHCGSNTDSVIADREQPGITFQLSRQMNLRRHALAAILDGVAEQVLEHVLDSEIDDQHRLRIVRELNTTLLNGRTPGALHSGSLPPSASILACKRSCWVRTFCDIPASADCTSG